MKIARQEGGLFVDVGANIGYFSTLWCGAKPGNHCIAVEASPRNIELLANSIKENGFTANCDIHPIAASNKEEILPFDQGPEAQTGWGGISEGVSSGTRVIKVDALPLHRIVSDGKRIRLLKIDVEGAEAMVLEGAEPLFEHQLIDEVWFEDNVARRELLDIKKQRLTASLERHGYCIRETCKEQPLPMDFVATLHPTAAIGN